MYDLIKEIDGVRYDSDMCVLEAYDDYLTKNMLMITEAGTFNANDKLLISKIIDGFKKALNAVRNFISVIINKIKTLFKKNSDKNINNIAKAQIILQHMTAHPNNFQMTYIYKY